MEQAEQAYAAVLCGPLLACVNGHGVQPDVMNRAHALHVWLQQGRWVPTVSVRPADAGSKANRPQLLGDDALAELAFMMAGTFKAQGEFAHDGVPAARALMQALLGARQSFKDLPQVLNLLNAMQMFGR